MREKRSGSYSKMRPRKQLIGELLERNYKVPIRSDLTLKWGSEVRCLARGMIMQGDH